jgi:hypothetical protein
LQNGKNSIGIVGSGIGISGFGINGMGMGNGFSNNPGGSSMMMQNTVGEGG